MSQTLHQLLISLGPHVGVGISLDPLTKSRVESPLFLFSFAV